MNTAELREEVAALRSGHGAGGVQASTDSDLVCELLAATAAAGRVLFAPIPDVKFGIFRM